MGGALSRPGRPLPSSLTGVKRASGDGQPHNLHWELLISLLRRPEQRWSRRGAAEASQCFPPVPGIVGAGGFGGEFWRGAGNVSSSQAARWRGTGRSPAGAAAVRHESESGAAVTGSGFRLVPAQLDTARSSFRLSPAQFDAGFSSPTHRLEEVVQGSSQLDAAKSPSGSTDGPAAEFPRIPAPARMGQKTSSLMPGRNITSCLRFPRSRKSFGILAPASGPSWILPKFLSHRNPKLSLLVCVFFVGAMCFVRKRRWRERARRCALGCGLGWRGKERRRPPAVQLCEEEETTWRKNPT
ncbi:uncharacterized protein LOC141917436 [Strix aluco]|uniref:uncharacterized protein LOC141917436 n=1 Tax=Strix aluco TaxID=111821 RepID=UPI003DA30D07